MKPKKYVINENEHGSLMEIHITGRTAEVWTWQPAWTPRAGECKKYKVPLAVAKPVAEMATGDINDIPEKIIRPLLDAL